SYDVGFVGLVIVHRLRPSPGSAELHATRETMVHLGLQRVITRVAGKGQHRHACVSSVATEIPQEVVVLKDRFGKTVLRISTINETKSGAIGNHIEIGELTHVAAEAAHIADIHNCAKPDL